MREMCRLGGLAAAAFALAGPGLAANAERGAEVFKTCAGCHQIGEGAESSVGPPLTGIVGRPAAATGFDHSAALLEARGDGLVWNEAALDAFLTAPEDYLSGTTMVYDGISDADQRADLITFLKAYDGMLAGFEVSGDLLAQAGDVAYGEYLAGECVACHAAGGTDIPSIAGWQRERFVTALDAYRQGALEHPVMQMVAGRLDDEQIASLADYFATLEN